MRRIETSLADAPVQFVSAHNDFTPWNTRVQNGHAGVFDWEYADHEQLPLFDPLHFVLGPMALKNEFPDQMLEKIRATLQACRQSLGEARCYQAETQVLAYLVNRCSLYLWADRGQRNPNVTVVSYGRLIDRLCQIPV
jgi:hypothetical protein